MKCKTCKEVKDRLKQMIKTSNEYLQEKQTFGFTEYDRGYLNATRHIAETVDKKLFNKARKLSDKMRIKSNKQQRVLTKAKKLI